MQEQSGAHTPSRPERWPLALLASTLVAFAACSGDAGAGAELSASRGDAAPDGGTVRLDAAPAADAAAPAEDAATPDAVPPREDVASPAEDAGAPAEDAGSPADAMVPDAGGGYATIDFDTAGTTYTLTGFGGAEDSIVIADPDDATNQVARVIKSATAELWAGTTVSTQPGDSLPRLPFDAANTRMNVRVRVPAAGTVVRLKIEDASDPTVTCETEATTTVGGSWHTITFDFAREAPGTARLDVSRRFNRVSIFFAFGRTGAAGGAGTYHFDDIAFIGGGAPSMDAGTSVDGGPAVVDGGTGSGFAPIDFDTAGVMYTLTGFGGAEDSTLAPDPVAPANNVARVLKSATAELWAGTTVSTEPNDAIMPLPITAANTRMSLRVYSPHAGIPVRLKIEDAADPTHSVEAEATVTVAGAWQTLTFDFANPAAGTAALNPAYRFNRISVFFNFGTTGAVAGERIYYVDDIAFGGGGAPSPDAGTSVDGGAAGVDGGPAGVDAGTGSGFAPIDFDTAGVTYTLTGFGGAENATVVADPSNSTQNVARVVKSATAELWAGVTASTEPNDSIIPLPLTAARTRMSLRVLSPHANIPVRLKIEDAADPTHSVETEATVTVAGAWQTLTFDFANQAPGTAALNLTYRFNRLSVFFNFGTTGAVAGERIYHFDDVTLLP
jgi:hypothetical protein